MFRILLAGFVGLFLSTFALAQGDLRFRLGLDAREARDLDFPAAASPIADAAAPVMAIYKPEGDGPFPAVVLQHQCGGLRNPRGWQNASVLEWAREAVAHGYVAFVLDSLGQRDVVQVCSGPQGGVNFARGVRDALQAAEHLRKLPYVDGRRVVQLGFSWGAMVATLATGRDWGTALAPGARFRAAAALYPGCLGFGPNRQYETLAGDIDVPLLVLAGGADNETPAADCVSRLERLKSSGAPVRWHLYPQATHCWDCSSLDGYRKTVRGENVQYKYDKEVTRDSVERVFAFFQEILK